MSQKRLVALLGSVILLDSMLFMVFAPLLPYYAHDLGFSKTAAGILMGGYAAGTLIGSVPAGWLGAGIGARWTLLGGLGMLVIASLGIALASSVLILDGARIVQGFGTAFSWTGAMGWLLSATRVTQRGRAIGQIMGVAAAGTVAGPLLGTLALAVGPSTTFAVIAAVGGGLVALVLRTPGHTAVSDESRSLRTVMRNPSMRGAMVATALPALVLGSLNVLAPLRLDHLGASGVLIGATYLTAAALLIFGQPLVGRFVDRRGRRLAIQTGLGIGTVLVLLVPIPGSTLPLAALVVAANVALGLVYTPAIALMAAGADETGIDQAISFTFVNLAWAVGQLVGPVVAGAVASATSDAVPCAAFGLVCGFATAAAWAYGRRTQPRRAGG